ncbi:SCO family protein [Ovoidimarina sediminis]|uniref:SCO family protein n=1 Tax=Ovoidimarina sediminis TaxID=3079856 RepID=UPI00290F09F0|nr:SCO family protein [Rhodophyticola sp. MJ-SS7]MDU8942513.1 SCO family protein [Rhodophyticola sp. MJ-SS7]
MDKTALIAIGAAVVAVAGLGTVGYMALVGGGDRFDPCRTTKIAGGAAEIGGPFTLVSQTGETVTEADVLDKPALVYFGYTFCPDVCPLDTVRNADAVDLLSGMGHDVRPVFISVDPGRDTPEVLADFTSNIHDGMIGLTGSEEQVDAAIAAYKAYARINEGDPDYYLVDHSTFTYLMLPEHGFVEFFRRDATAEDIATRTACFLDAA